MNMVGKSETHNMILGGVVSLGGCSGLIIPFSDMVLSQVEVAGLVLGVITIAV